MRAGEPLCAWATSIVIFSERSGISTQGIKARDLLHDYMEKAIVEKLQRKDSEAHSDALDFIINSAKEHGKEFTMQELKVRSF